MEPATRIERATCGLRISDKGIAQVVDDWAIPPSYLVNHTFLTWSSLFQFSSFHPDLALSVTPY
ncbi:hypothetical protein [Petrachloros mirabilis]